MGLGTKEKILEAAKQHFAEFGLAHASIRAITRMAGVNSALIRYHYGSKHALYEEVVRAIARRLIATRVAALEDLRAAHGGDVVPIEQLLRAYAEPLFPRAHADLSQDAAIYLRFFGRMYTEPSDELKGIIQSQFTELQLMYIEEIHKAVAHLSRETTVFRFGLLIGSLTLLGSKLGVLSILSAGRLNEDDTAATLSQYVTAYAALFRAPEPSA
ncbi:MAG TPA: TetR/AcrR family transcriptional regulator [Steroidobacteraceae bacterium]|nr:TetR/AcrR family transcriptional regulator [Steroidobacteraceae bacterium]